MLQKLLKEIMVSIAGKQAEEIVDLLDGKKYVNEFIIAKKLNLTINQTRNILYKISDHGLVSFIRKKDKRKGWYTYFWKIEIMKCLEFLKASIIKKMEQVSHQIKSRETKEFYVCERCHIEFNEENALLYNFTCPECGNLLSRKDNTPVIKEYNKEMDKLRKELELVEEEFNKEKEKNEKTKAREMKKEEKIKKIEKEKIKAARIKAKKKEEKNNLKKEKPKTSKKKTEKKNISKKKEVKKRKK
jgi:transcription initiation factor TFIIE subunit alpha